MADRRPYSSESTSPSQRSRPSELTRLNKVRQGELAKRQSTHVCNMTKDRFLDFGLVDLDVLSPGLHDPTIDTFLPKD
jgi:hypothetical protein